MGMLGAIGGWLGRNAGTISSYATTAATAYSMYDARKQAKGISELPPSDLMEAPVTTPDALKDISASTTKKQEEAKAKQRQRLANKSGTVTNVGGYAGLNAPVLPSVAAKKTLGA